MLGAGLGPGFTVSRFTNGGGFEGRPCPLVSYTFVRDCRTPRAAPWLCRAPSQPRTPSRPSRFPRGPPPLEALPLLHRKGARSQRGAEAGVERRGRLPRRALLLAEPRCSSPSPGRRGPPPSSRSAAWAGPDRERSGPGAAAAGPWRARGLAGLHPRAGRAPARAPAPSRPSFRRACTGSTASVAACTPSSPTRCRSPPSSSTGEAAWDWRSGRARGVVCGWEIFVCRSEVSRGARGPLRGAGGAFRGAGGLAWG